MGTKFNVIRVGDDIEKVYVDFSSYESLKESTGFRKLYTIHTAETNAMSDKLHFHVGGFCDDYGQGGGELAGRISGYGDLPSDLILCLMDDKYNFLPLDEARLECLYSYLKTGKALCYLAFIGGKVGEFFHSTMINPPLIDIGVEPEIILFGDHPNVAAIRYDVSSLSDDDRAIQKFGGELFKLSDDLVKHYVDKGGRVRISPNEDFYLVIENRIGQDGSFNILLQAIKDESDEVEIEDTSLYLGEAKEPDCEDAREEVEENDWDDDEYFFTHILEVSYIVDWPDYEDKLHYEDSFAYFNLEEDPTSDDIFFFGDTFHIEGIDRINDELQLTLKLGSENKELTLKLDKPYTFKFDYLKNENPESHRVGEMTLTLRKKRLTESQLPGRINLNFKCYVDGELETDETATLNNLSGIVEDNDLADPYDGYTYAVLEVDADSDYLLVAVYFDDDGENKISYIPVDCSKEGVRFARKSTQIVEGEKREMILEAEYINE